MRHLLERGRDQAGKADRVGVLALRGIEDRLRRHHDAEVEHVVVVALEHDRHDVLADVVHIAFDGSEHHFALGPRRLAASCLLCLDVGDQVCHRLLHHAR